MSKAKTKKQRDTWHKLLGILAEQIPTGEPVNDYKHPVDNVMCLGLKSQAKDRAGLLYQEDVKRMEAFYEALITAAEQAERNCPNITPCEFLVAARPRIVKAKVQRRSSETYDIEEYSAVIGQTELMFIENELPVPLIGE